MEKVKQAISKGMHGKNEDGRAGETGHGTTGSNTQPLTGPNKNVQYDDNTGGTTQGHQSRLSNTSGHDSSHSTGNPVTGLGSKHNQAEAGHMGSSTGSHSTNTQKQSDSAYQKDGQAWSSPTSHGVSGGGIGGGVGGQGRETSGLGGAGNQTSSSNYTQGYNDGKEYGSKTGAGEYQAVGGQGQQYSQSGQQTGQHTTGHHLPGQHSGQENTSSQLGSGGQDQRTTRLQKKNSLGEQQFGKNEDSQY